MVFFIFVKIFSEFPIFEHQFIKAIPIKCEIKSELKY